MYSNKVHNMNVVSSSWLASNINANAKRNFQTKYSNPKAGGSSDYHFRDGENRLEELALGKSQTGSASLSKKGGEDEGDSDLDENDPLTIQIKQIIMEELNKPKTRISQLNLGITGLQYVFDAKQPWGCKLFWLSIIVSCISVCSYQMVDRVGLFLRYPVAAEIGVVQNQTVQFPTLIACPVETQALAEVNADYKKTTGENFTDCDDLTLAHLVGYEYKGKKLSADDVWKLTDPYAQDYFHGYKFQDLLLDQDNAFITNKSITMFNGMCIQFDLNRYVDFHGIATQINMISTVVKPPFYCNRYGYKLLVMDTHDPPDMKQLVPVTSGAKVGFTILVKQYEALDAPNNPCISSEQYKICHMQCAQAMLDKDINCTLPYMKQYTSKKRMCDNAAEALSTQKVSEDILLELNVSRECGCIKKCIRVMYSMLPKSYKFNSDKTDVAVYYASNYFEIVKESYAYDWMSLLCDIGGNLGLYLGLSVLSVFEIVQSFFETYKREAAQNLARQHQQHQLQLEKGNGADKRRFNDRISTSYGHYGNINQGFNADRGYTDRFNSPPRTNVW